MLHSYHRFLTEDIILIRADFKHFLGADLHTLAASIALICIDSDEPVARTVFKTKIGYHIFSNYQ